jgi:plasmid maintenance system antidote protein VapI
MENYKSHITELMALLKPRTPLEVRSQREQEVTGHKENIAHRFKEIVELYDKSTQLWTNLQEDKKLQELERKEEGVNTVV